MSAEEHGPARSDRPEGGRGPDQRGGGSDRREGGSDHRDARGRERGAARASGQGHRTAAAPAARRRGTDLARGAAFDVLRAVDGSDSYANLVLPPMLRDRGISGRDAAFATELAYGTLRLRGRYDAIIEICAARTLDRIEPEVLDLLRLGTHQLLGMRVPAHAAVSETVGLARERTGVGSGQFVNAVLRSVGRESLETWLEKVGAAADPAGTDPVARLAATESHPTWVTRALREALVGNGRSAEELGDLLRADNVAPHVTLVARPGLIRTYDLLQQTRNAGTRGRWASTAVVLSGGDPGGIPAIRDGLAGVQDEGSQLVTLALAAANLIGERDERWLDLCAGPGGKAALLGMLAHERGARIVANEVTPHRVRLVEHALASLPPEAVEEIRTGDGRAVGQDEPGSYDRVLVDAPCTGLGALRRRPEARWRRTPADLSQLGALQRELLASALDAVRPGGVVGYVTCSPHLAETQLVVKDVLRKRDDVEILDARSAVRRVAGNAIPLGERHDIQLWPHVHGTDAMHLTLLRKHP
ncbi:RsmB/NOP family class I SAM-dependent RNA methyltransferase [Pengzhenrongella sicca]|uniref:rRNA small subunit methyltransferase B n=1 Tax=Pengzhenrongella sicca TaxID=2819238 RepID=A0A8A4ZAA8_9MICO|nr:transcription antitermination factor NusB [Pengzhenrongella sicca]QTE27823.1 rRNA small subunit methyltransferase B [Pengzhenrongella sicca]